MPQSLDPEPYIVVTEPLGCLSDACCASQSKGLYASAFDTQDVSQTRRHKTLLQLSWSQLML